MYTCWNTVCHIHPLLGLGGAWGLGVTKHLKYDRAKTEAKNKTKKGDQCEVRLKDTESDTDFDKEMHLTNKNWSRFLLMKSASEERPLSKLSPFAVQIGFRTIA